MDCKTITLFLLLLSLPLNLQCTESPKWIRGGYWDSHSELPISEINSALFTHLMCAFATINSTTFNIFINSTYEQSFSNFTSTVKRKNPSVVTILSIRGGKQVSETFSSMINQSAYRKSFIKSSIEIARLHGFQGLDLSGVLPGQSTNMTNLGTLFDEWRNEITSEARNSGAHAALYGPSTRLNTNNSITQWLNRGFQANKLVLGLPYHGYEWKLVNPNANGIGAPASGPGITLDGSMGYKFIKAYIRDYGFGAASVYNDTYVVNFFTSGNNWINFDSVDAIRTKVLFAKQKGLLGYKVFQLANDDKWELSSAAGDEDLKKNKPRLLVIIPVTLATAILLLGIIVCFLQRIVFKKGGFPGIARKSVSKLRKRTATENIDRNANNLQVFRFTTIKVATNDFSIENKLGEGGYGPVYKGRLPKGQEIAVKRLSRTSHQGLEEFENEVKLTARLQHVNLAPVLGICTDREEKMLIYEYMPNKSLDFYIFDMHKRYLLDWTKRVRIIEGITQGLLYLQEYSNFTIVHRDLKASNILLDNEMNPKISDFGMARAFKKDECEANTGRIVGTYGYVPPEYVGKGKYSMKYDVYSYGVLLLQIISGKRTSCYYGSYENLNLLEYAYELWKHGEGMEFFDSTLDDSSSPWKLIRCMKVALLCVQENPADRPTMLEILTMLRNETAAIKTPKKPAFSIKKEEDEESDCILQVKICSVNDASITQLVPR
ncbi:Receptor-like kinase CHRK1 [Melia azedarach]|uniref:Receptor-like kinase CHRK1 n=1 Tax=Melia azedarach TaxID=155640 RepID=A0ACC1XG17_MELAZ|nr:Receptor-like kinase CHRK1 [Melia azedarach]